MQRKPLLIHQLRLFAQGDGGGRNFNLAIRAMPPPMAKKQPSPRQYDPIVEPFERLVPSFGRHQFASPAPVAQASSRPAASQFVPPQQQQSSDALLTALQKLVQQRTNDDDDWNSRKGQERGIRLRTGQHPPPPQWRYDSQDMRAFAKFSKKVRIWQIQMTPYASAADQALLFLGSLTCRARSGTSDN